MFCAYRCHDDIVDMMIAGFLLFSARNGVGKQQQIAERFIQMVRKRIFVLVGCIDDSVKNKCHPEAK